LNQLKTRFQPIRILAEYPITHVQKNGQAIKGWVDLLLETPEGWVLVDHKFTDEPSALSALALRYSGQLKAYVDAVEAATGKPILSCWVHFPTFGQMFNIVT
jgi:ATP-dependent exoDNAse (exonuclease V) beta subunit